ncbi:MAG: aldehyde dehydrogenase family protein, partial [Blastocatellia bacterium]
MAIATINPATGETLKIFAPLTSAQIEAKLELAQVTYREYRRRPLAERLYWLANAAEILESEKEKFAAVMTTEMGKPLK